MHTGSPTSAEKKSLRVHEYARIALQAVLFAFCLLLPFGKAFEVIGGIAGLVLVLVYYLAGGYAESNLKRLPYKGLFAFFFLFPIYGTLASQWVAHSFQYVKPAVTHAFPLFFMALEGIRTKKDMQHLGLAFFGGFFLDGCNGIWQYVTGFDLLMGYPIDDGRLTGASGKYRVGNHMALALLASLATWWAWRRVRLPGVSSEGLQKYLHLILFFLLLAPGIFLLIFAQARSAFVGLCAAFGMFLLVVLRPGWKWFLTLGAGFVVLLLWGPKRLSLEQAMADGRWELWNAAWRIFLEHPLTGSGPSTFKPAYKELSIVFMKNSQSIPHPHSIYMQTLVDGGLLGVAIIGGLLIGVGVVWCGKKIFDGYNEAAAAPASELASLLQSWHLTTIFWLGFICYLGIGIFGHNFYQSWLLSLGMTFFGAALAGIVRVTQENPVLQDG